MFLMLIYLFFLTLSYFGGVLDSWPAILIFVVFGILVVLITLTDISQDHEHRAVAQWHEGFRNLQHTTQPILASIESLKEEGGVPWKDHLSEVTLALTYPAETAEHQAVAKVLMTKYLMGGYLRGNTIWIRIDPENPGKAYVDLDLSPVQV